MPKSNRGGKGGSVTAPRPIPAPTPTPAPTPAPPIRVTGGGGGGGFAPLTQKQVVQVQQAQQEYLDAQDVRVRYAVKQYIRADTQANGKSRSQNMNNKLETDGQLDPTERMMVKNLDKAMSPIGKNTMLVRADHAITGTGSGLMEKLNLTNYQSLSPSQLNAALVGKTWTEKKYLSTSYNVKNNPFINGAQSGGRAVIMNIKAPANTKMVVGDRSQAEYILARGGNYKITGARFTGKTANPAAGGSYRQIEIDVEII